MKKFLRVISICFIFLLTICHVSVSQPSATIQNQIDSLHNQKKRLLLHQDSIYLAIDKVDASIKQLEFEINKSNFKSEGYPATITNDNCVIGIDGIFIKPGQGARITVVGASSSTTWKVIYSNQPGTASAVYVKFDDSTLNTEAIKSKYLAEAKAQRENQIRMQDSIATAEKVRKELAYAAYLAEKDSIAAAEHSQLDTRGKSNYPFRVNYIRIEGINSAAGVDFAMSVHYLNKDKTIKYLYFTVVPYNAVGDKVLCDLRGYGEFTAKITGPINASYETNLWEWEAAWYNNTVVCLKIIKVVVEYTDGSSYTYINDIGRLLSGFNKNDCSYH